MGTDNLFEVRNQENESYFLALGIDVTYRELLSEIYKEKFFKLLHSIKDGYKTKIKYCKDHNGKIMKEFYAPKIVLFLNANDVKKIVDMIKNIKDPVYMENFKNDPMKISIMNQMLIQCKMLADFAEKNKVNIFRKYSEIILTIKELAFSEPEIKKILDHQKLLKDQNQEDPVTKHMKYLIEEFEEREKQNRNFDK